MAKPSVGERFRYWFDNWMSKGTVAIMLLLGLATLAFVTILGVVSWIVLKALPDNLSPDPGDDPIDMIWLSLMRTLDPGTMGGDQGWWFRILMLLVTIGGLVIVASLIGIVSGAFDGKIEELRKGRSSVIENDHSVILGWNRKIFTVIAELATANESRGRAAIVILADKSKVEMEDEIRAAVGATGRTSVICRTGDPKRPADLALVSPGTARSVIVLAPDGADDPDAEVLKCTLALSNSPDLMRAGLHIVAELQHAASLELARLVTGGNVKWVLSPDLIGRIIVQSCRGQSGLSTIYQELLDFDGVELYSTEQPSLVGQSFLQAQLAFADSVAVGIVRHGGGPVLNPPADTVLGHGDQLIVLAEDDSTIKLAVPGRPGACEVELLPRAAPDPEHFIVLGSSEALPSMLHELDTYVVAGSTIQIVTQQPVPDLPACHNLTVTVTQADHSLGTVLAGLGIAAHHQIIVLAEGRFIDPRRADDRTLFTLLQLHGLSEDGARPRIVSEMLDDENRALAVVAEVDDFVVSGRFVALALAQIAENARIAEVFEELFSATGNGISLRDAADYVPPGRSSDFYSVLAVAARRGETAIGYRVAAHARDPERRYGIVLNPLKTDRIDFAPGDACIVLARD